MRHVSNLVSLRGEAEEAAREHTDGEGVGGSRGARTQGMWHEVWCA